MSSSNWVAQFTVQSAPFYWATATTPNGNLEDAARIIDEMLTTPGVDYASWRRKYIQFRQLPITTLEDATADQTNNLLVNNYVGAIGLFGTLIYKYRSTIRTWKNVKVVDVVTKDIPGPLVGFGASIGSVVATRAVWQLLFTQVSQAS